MPLGKAPEEPMPVTNHKSLAGGNYMTTLNDGTIIKDTWTLINFVKAKGKMFVSEFVNKDSGEAFDACKFVNGSQVTLVAFGSKLKEKNGNKPLTPQQIAARKDELEICEWEKPDGKHGFTLYKPGDPDHVGTNNREVDLGI